MDDKLRVDGDRKGMPSFVIGKPRNQERVFQISICVPHIKKTGKKYSGEQINHKDLRLEPHSYRSSVMNYGDG